MFFKVFEFLWGGVFPHFRVFALGANELPFVNDPY